MVPTSIREVDLEDHRCSERRAVLGPDQHPGRRQIDRLAEELAAGVAECGLDVGGQPYLDPRRDLEEIRHLIADDFRRIGDQHDAVDSTAPQRSCDVDLVRLGEHQDGGIAAR